MENQDYTNEEIEALVKRVQDSADHEAYADLYNHFVDKIYRYIYYRVNSGEAEDLVETVFMKVWENIRQYKPASKTFSAWIFRIAHNLVVDHYRAAKEITSELDYDIADTNDEVNPLKLTEKSLNHETLKRAIKKLKKQYQEIVVMKFINDLSNKEIADLLGKNEGTLRILQFRALRALKKELKSQKVDY